MNELNSHPSMNEGVGLNKMTTIRLFLIVICISLFFVMKSAGAFLWPVVVDVSVETNGDREAHYSGRWEVVDIDDAFDVVGWKNIGLGHRHNNGGSAGQTAGEMSPVMTVSNKDCPGDFPLLSCLGARWVEKFGTSGTYNIVHYGEIGNECVAIVSPQKIVDAPWSSVKLPLTPVSTCIGTPPANQFCELKTPELLYDYGPLSSNDASGAKQTQDVEIHCTSDIDYILRLQAAENIPLGNGMVAKFTTDNGEPLGSVLHGSDLSRVQLTSELAGKPETSGPFEGSGVLFITYP